MITYKSGPRTPGVQPPYSRPLFFPTTAPIFSSIFFRVPRVRNSEFPAPPSIWPPAQPIFSLKAPRTPAPNPYPCKSSLNLLIALK